ncbi:tripartite tricarboxylate transporter TctB family protein [Nitrincola sp.]|uniref:tripartite tricarboxylate transporter TctB family protein n=1 Tax=Nitrincola sp. TaxID=1926584 RepID=UPI003A92B1C9
MLRSLNWLQLVAALLLALTGVFIIWQGSEYPLGSLRRMGPGFYPVIIGSVLVLFSALLTLEVAREEPEKNVWIPRPILMISSGFICFGALLESAGLVPAILAMVILTSLAEKPVRPLSTALTAISLSILGVVVFIYGLNIPVAAIQW